MKLSYKHRLQLWFVMIFAAFAVVVIVLERAGERRQKTAMLERQLDTYAEIAEVFLKRADTPQLDSLVGLLPDNIRLTLVAADGTVLYDNDVVTGQNHALRPEIIDAAENGSGSAIRTSASNNRDYLYYAKRFGDHYLRVALPYDITLRNVLAADNYFIYWVAALFVVVLLTINYVTGRFARSVRRLRDFTLQAGDGDALPPDFSADELGEAGMRIAESYRQLRESKRAISLEREKLLQHVHTSEEGICFFSSDRRVEFYNGLFIQYLNIIADNAPSDISVVFTDPAFTTLFEDAGENFRQLRIDRHGRHFLARTNLFDDGSFEIIINDITSPEKTRLIKHEMTGNIAHELRTPVTTIRGYLETILDQRLDADKQRQFTQRAYDQTIALSELISDMSLITRIEEAPGTFATERIEIARLLEALHGDLSQALSERQMTMQWAVPATTAVEGNRSLIYSVFRNLTDNSVRYAGQGAAIRISLYNSDERFYYFSFSDNGVGIPDERHLARLFERFYRINEGRTRDTGGTGLGLSIVRNAIALHHGTISVKNAPGGGLEFLFKLPKA